MSSKHIHFQKWGTTVESGIQISETRLKVRNLTKELGFTHTDQILISSVVSECSRILLNHFSSFKIHIENKEGIFIKIYMLKKDIRGDNPTLIPSPVDILSILNIELLNSQTLFNKVLSVRENGSGPYLILKKDSNISQTDR